MFGVSVQITKFVDPHQPGFVECHLLDALGRLWSFVEKVPVVSTEDLDYSSTYPRAGVIACEVVARRTDGEGREVVEIDTELPWHVETVEGVTRFTVWPQQVMELQSAV
jgi:hypothetical protein